MKIIKYKKVIYVIAIIFMVMYFLVSMNNNVIAGTGTQSSSGTTSAEETLKGIYTEPTDKAGLDTKMGNYLWVSAAIGLATGVIMIAVIGIRYIVASPEGKADIKKQAFMYMIGAALIISGSTFVGVIAEAAKVINQ